MAKKNDQQPKATSNPWSTSNPGGFKEYDRRQVRPTMAGMNAEMDEMLQKDATRPAGEADTGDNPVNPGPGGIREYNARH